MTGQAAIRSVVEASPPSLFVALKFGGIALPDWVAIATLGYIFLQSAYLIWRWVRAARYRRADD